VHEAFAAGLPVLASHMGVMADAVTDGVNGLLLPPGDVAAWQAALTTLTADRERLAALAAAVPAPPTVADHLTRLEAIYHQVRQGTTSPAEGSAID
jgi:glycosyltransferase involved in cell wall biosynthesis